MCPKPLETLPVTPEVADFLAMHRSWLGSRIIGTEIDSPLAKPGRVVVIVSKEFRNHVDRIAVREKTNLSDATYLAVMELMFSPPNP